MPEIPRKPWPHKTQDRMEAQSLRKRRAGEPAPSTSAGSPAAVPPATPRQPPGPPQARPGGKDAPGQSPFLSSLSQQFRQVSVTGLTQSPGTGKGEGGGSPPVKSAPAPVFGPPNPTRGSPADRPPRRWWGLPGASRVRPRPAGSEGASSRLWGRPRGHPRTADRASLTRPCLGFLTCAAAGLTPADVMCARAASPAFPRPPAPGPGAWRLVGQALPRPRGPRGGPRACAPWRLRRLASPT